MNIFQRNPIIHIVAGALVLWGIIFLAISHSCAETTGELPNAPSSVRAMPSPTETYGPDERMIVHNTPDHDPPTYKLVDRQFVIVHALYLGAAAFDYYTTVRGLANTGYGPGQCDYHEGNRDLGPHPHSGRVVGYAIGEVAAVVAGDLALKALGRHLRVPKIVATLVSSGPAMYGIGMHVHGGMGWVKTGCF